MFEYVSKSVIVTIHVHFYNSFEPGRRYIPFRLYNLNSFRNEIIQKHFLAHAL